MIMKFVFHAEYFFKASKHLEQIIISLKTKLFSAGVLYYLTYGRLEGKIRIDVLRCLF